MSHEVSIVYRATDPEGMREILSRWQDQMNEFWEASREYGEELGGELRWYEGAWHWGPVELIGVDEVPEGWHCYKTKSNQIQPHQGGRTKAAEQVRDRIASIRSLRPSVLRSFIAENFDVPVQVFKAFGFAELDGDYWLLSSYLMWRDEEGNPSEEGNEYFERATAAEYYRAKANQMEADDAER